MGRTSFLKRVHSSFKRPDIVGTMLSAQFVLICFCHPIPLKLLQNENYFSFISWKRFFLSLCWIPEFAEFRQGGDGREYRCQTKYAPFQNFPPHLPMTTFLFSLSWYSCCCSMADALLMVDVACWQNTVKYSGRTVFAISYWNEKRKEYIVILWYCDIYSK